MAQAFAQLGSQVVLVESNPCILSREDPAAAGIIQQALQRDGVQVHGGSQNLSIQTGTETRLRFNTDDAQHDLPIDKLLVAVGRTPNVDDLNLAQVGVATSEYGVQVNPRMQTTNRMIYAAGDVCSRYRFTHAADFMARLVIQNSLFWGRQKSSSLVIPWCTYTTPELAHVGLSTQQAEAEGVKIDTYTRHFSQVDRAILAGQDQGFVKVHTAAGSDRIVGATIVAEHAGDLIAPITLAMTHGLGLGKIGNTIHPYPTQAEAIRQLGDQYNRTRLTPTIQWLFKKWLAWTR
jgi:pyruvate/2-oxoglutarate dehydrogenase complex dihydrolipoamide dehydrogenase (E3) component